MNKNRPLPIVTDLDGTLINTDILLESFLKLIKKNPLSIFKIIFWVFKGKSYLKDRIAKEVDIDVSILPYNLDLLNYLKSQKGSRKLILASASNEKFVGKIAEFLGIFDHFIGSDENNNFSGHKKAQKLKALLGSDNYIYAGNSSDDLPIWNRCKNAIIVNLPRSIKNKLNQNSIDISSELSKEKTNFITLIECLRIYQWTKNLLIFVPLLFAQQFVDSNIFFNSLIAFIVFGMCASSIYILNDLLDIEDDRRHRTKKNRPIPSGKISLVHSLFLVPILLVISFYISTRFLPTEFNIILLAYLFMTVTYSFYLKSKILIDVLILACLYTLRIMAGTAAINESYSFWLITFSIFVFFSLALIKRCSELLLAKQANSLTISFRDYQPNDIDLLLPLGASSGLISVLILALFIDSDQIAQKYTSPELLWFLIPITIYWLTRAWMITHRGKMDDDPIVFAIKDKTSICVGIAVLAIVFGAMRL